MAMAYTTHVLVERLTGDGTLYRDERPFARVLYTVTTEQEMLHRRRQVTAGRIATSGYLVVLEGEQDLPILGEVILVLSTGRRLPITVERQGIDPSDWHFTVSGAS
jgi:hypothetical protein